MSRFSRLTISPPLINSASPWASDLNDLRALYSCPHTGAVTTRTATWEGFPDDPHLHQVAFVKDSFSSINSYGYSPHPLSQYLSWVTNLLQENPNSKKPFIISITSPINNSPNRSDLINPGALKADHGDELSLMLAAVQSCRRLLQDNVSEHPRIAIEINTSCPNIKDHPPPSYDPPSLRPMLEVISKACAEDPSLAVGLKLPPYVYSRQFVDMVDLLSSYTTEVHGVPQNPISFLTCTNTLGSAALFRSQSTRINEGVNDSDSIFALPSEGGAGGLAGEFLHPLALGNVQSFSTLLREHRDLSLRAISVIGVGGVVSAAAAERMLQAGATVVGCATILGMNGISVFEKIARAPSICKI